MNNEEIKEIIKALSYGITSSQIINTVDVSAEEIEAIKKEHSAEIEKMKAYHKKMGV